MTAPTGPDYRALYEAAEVARIKLAADLAGLRQHYRREALLRAHPILEPVIALVRGETDEDYAAHGRELAEAIASARGA